MPIGTAAPDADELAAARHHFVGCLELEDYYSAARFETDVMALLPELFSRSDYAILCGGSMLYVDAVTNGIDELPTISEEVRKEAYGLLEKKGIEGVRQRLEELDPVYYGQVDQNNHKGWFMLLKYAWRPGALIPNCEPEPGKRAGSRS